MIKQYLVLLFVLVAIDYAISQNTKDCPHQTFLAYHICRRYDKQGKERACDLQEAIDQMAIVGKKFTGNAPRLIHTLYFAPVKQLFIRLKDKKNKDLEECESKDALPKYQCTRPANNKPWTCVAQTAIKPIHSTQNGHLIKS